MRAFLWEGCEEEKRDHLLKWETVCRPIEEGGIGLGNVVSKNLSLLGKWLWRFPMEPDSIWHKVIKSKYGTNRNRWDALAGANASSFCPWKTISQVSSLFIPLVKLKVGNGDKILFWEDQWAAEIPFSSLFPRLFHISSVHLASISEFLVWNDDVYSWNLHFRRDLSERDIEDLSSLLLILDRVSLSTLPDSRTWLVCRTGIFNCSSFYTHLTNSNPGSPSFSIHNLIWKSRIPQKVKAFSWTAALNKINTLDNLQKRRPHKALSPNVCIICLKNAESVAHLFLHCEVARYLWSRLFIIKGESWVCTESLLSFLAMDKVGFGGSKEKRILWECACFAIIWVIWIERNERIFKGRSQTVFLLWEKVLFLAAMWSKAAGIYHDMAITHLMRNDWQFVLDS